MNSDTPHNPAEGETTHGDIIVGIVGCLGAAWLIIEALYMIVRGVLA